MSLKGFTGKITIPKKPIKEAISVPSITKTKKIGKAKEESTAGEILQKAINTLSGIKTDNKNMISNILKKLDMSYDTIPNMQQKDLLYNLVTETLINKDKDDIINKMKEIIDEIDLEDLKFDLVFEKLMDIFPDEKEIVISRKNELNIAYKNYISQDQNKFVTFPDIDDIKADPNNILNEIVEITNNFDKNDSYINNLYKHLPSLERNRINYYIQKDIFRNKPLITKGLYKCKKCGSDRTVDFSYQIRSGDEPMTIFIDCLDCKYHWKD
jgi:DNA-directed RNA polymerase subunit M/transcription elongation factor TFIIS